MILKLDVTNKQIEYTAAQYENVETVNGFGYSPDYSEIAILTSYNKDGLIKNKLYIYPNNKVVIAKFR